MTMSYPTIHKQGDQAPRKRPNLVDYDGTRAAFRWDDARKELDGLPGGGLNLGYEAIDRHVASGRGDKVAMLWEGRNGEQQTYTFAQTQAETNRFANALRTLGVRKGDRVFTFLDRVPSIYFAVFGALKLGAVIGPLFSAFGPDPVRDRLLDSGAKVLVTSPELKRKITGILRDLPALETIIIAGEGSYTTDDFHGRYVRYEEIMAQAPPTFQIERTTENDYSIMHYTSGTTGKPKGAAHVHGSVLAQYLTGKYVLDLQPEDIYWCTADPGWVTGTSYGLIAPWTSGVTQVIYEG
ncbi:MAG: AMP-binding protein, partial [Chloroflexi bacterium]|nr:AMP-binding protein [Chloroflexota bacterium]